MLYIEIRRVLAATTRIEIVTAVVPS